MNTEIYCRRTDLRVQVDVLDQAVSELTTMLFRNRASFLAWLTSKKFATINLNHIPDLTTVTERFFRFNGDHPSLVREGVSEGDFTVTSPEVDGSPLGDVIRMVTAYHRETTGLEFVGRNQLIWVNPTNCYPLHRDKHTPHRYHIPIETNPECLWVLREAGEIATVHMPADGAVWYLNPVDTEHSVANLGSTTRLHLLMTSAV